MIKLNDVYNGRFAERPMVSSCPASVPLGHACKWAANGFTQTGSATLSRVEQGHKIAIGSVTSIKICRSTNDLYLSVYYLSRNVRNVIIICDSLFSFSSLYRSMSVEIDKKQKSALSTYHSHHVCIRIHLFYVGSWFHTNVEGEYWYCRVLMEVHNIPLPLSLIPSWFTFIRDKPNRILLDPPTSSGQCVPRPIQRFSLWNSNRRTEWTLIKRWHE